MSQGELLLSYLVAELELLFWGMIGTSCLNTFLIMISSSLSSKPKHVYFFSLLPSDPSVFDLLKLWILGRCCILALNSMALQTVGNLQSGPLLTTFLLEKL